jgi:peroxiredoxin
MRLRSIPLVVALLVFVAGACATALDSGSENATVAPASTTPARASVAVKGQARFAPPGLLPVARRQPAPALRVTAFDGRTVSLDGLRGRPVVVSFFESWCGTCQAEQPDLTKVAGDFAGRVGFVGVSYRDTVAAGRTYQRRFKVPYPLANDASGRTWARWGVPYQPVVVLVDKHGRIAERFDGGTTGGTLTAALTYLLGE